MTQAPASVFKIPTESPQLAHSAVGRARRAPAARAKPACRASGVETRAATRGDGEVIELDHGVSVYPPRDKGGRWRAAWYEDGKRQQCESVSQDKLAGKLEKVRQRLAAGASNMTRPGADLIGWYLNLDRLPVARRWSRKHADSQRRPGMTASAAAAARMTKGRQADSGRRRERVLNTLAEMARDGEAVTVSALARRAAVDRSFLYRHPDLLAQAHVSATQPPPGGATAPSRASLQADLLAANDRCRRLSDQVRVLEHRRSAELGQQVWQRTGIGAPTDIDGLRARIRDLEQQNLDLKIQLDERTDELEAARSANRELTKTLNQPGRTP